jgi:ABC-2 type transport system ATP-binding protein
VDGNVIELTDLTKQYGSFTAVDQLNLTIHEGEIFGLLGPNGAGKSTTILMMLGLTEPTSGSVKVCGINSTTNPIDVKKIVGYLPEDIGFYDELTGMENLMFTARLNAMSRKTASKKSDLILERVGLSNEKNKKVGKYSRGMRQRLGLADVLIKNPEVIILDEPTLGIDPKGVREFLELIVKLSKEEGLTVLISSHHLHQVQQICDRVGLFISGKMIAEGDIATLSGQMFSHEPYIIEAEITSNNVQKLTKTLKSINGVISIKTNDNIFHIGCSRDAASDIARITVESDSQLNYLVKKEYGLDDIYNRYFEGEENHE